MQEDGSDLEQLVPLWFQMFEQFVMVDASVLH